MCMLTAVFPARGFQAWEKKMGMFLVSELLLANSTSGNKDGIGLGSVDGAFIKWEAAAKEVVFTKEYNEALQRFMEQPFIAHVRAISTGVGAKEGAHPFRVGNILLAHNGTFTNYGQFTKKYKKELNDTNPVDSHVITYMLAEQVGTEHLNQTHIAATLDQTKGSYALLITDAATMSMWVVAGSNPLYVQHSGPLWLVNTSKFTLESMSDNVAGVAKLIYDKEWKVGEIERVPEFTIHLLTNKGLVKVSDLEKPEAAAPYYTHYLTRGTAGRRGDYTENKAVSSEDARTRAVWAEKIAKLPGMGRLELTLGCFILLEVEWWKAEIECLEVLHATFEQISADFGSTIKKELWAELMSITGQNAYGVVAAYTDIAFPYMLNSVQTLRKFVEEVRQDLKDGNSIPIVDYGNHV